MNFDNAAFIFLRRNVCDGGEKTVIPVKFCDFSELGGIEKDLENLLAKNLEDFFTDGAVSLMPVFQERPIQEEPDICALDSDGNLIIFELKRRNAGRGAIEQIMRYAELYGRRDYAQLNDMYKKYVSANGLECSAELKDAHAAAFELSAPLSEEAFNRRQKLVIVGNSADIDLIRAVDYWRSKGIDIDFLPYRFYKIGENFYFEFFAKPYDYHINPGDKKGIMFDTNKTYSDEDEALMLSRSRVEAYGDAKWAVDSFRKGDYVLFYSKGRGVIAIGQVTSDKAKELTDNDGRYHEVKMIVPHNVSSEGCNKNIMPYEVKELLEQGFYFARTDKRPYLSEEQVNILIDELKKRYSE